MAAKKKPAQKKAVTKKAPAKKASASKAPAKKAGAQADAKKKPGRPPKTSSSTTELKKSTARVSKEVDDVVSETRELIKSVSGVSPQTAITFVSELITANDIKSASLRKRVLAWFKRP
jgi:hypothetical protein